MCVDSIEYPFGRCKSVFYTLVEFCFNTTSGNKEEDVSEEDEIIVKVKRSTFTDHPNTRISVDKCRITPWVSSTDVEMNPNSISDIDVS